ncbi:hypothetical protein J6590_069017 [Homalodisca vitripennis]|nr:hypothetical protein J6590_069017 [Homalodisca vitripennis]
MPTPLLSVAGSPAAAAGAGGATRDVSVTPHAVAPAPCVRASTPLSCREAARPMSATEVADLVAENSSLKERVLQLEEQFNCVLDHSIESDTRLMQYTDQVFVASASRRDSPVRASAADCGVQCDLPTICRDQLCAESRDLVASLRVTIEVLEAELQCLKEEKRRCEFEGGPTSEWTVCQNRKPPPISTENRYKALASVTDTHQTALCLPKPSVKPSSRSNKHNKTKKQTRKANVQLPFSSILIEGDSHSRDLAALVRRRVSHETNVEGVCRPGEKLLEATSDDLPPPGGCSVIVAGPNDVASEEECNIYRHLERRITRKLGTSRVIVATLPHRHDLPASHRINRETALVNNYIEELCARYCGAEVLDFNRNGRAAFTSHGMHLKRTSKHLLAELLVKCLREMSHFAPRAPSLSATAVAEPPSRPLEPPAQRPTASDPPVAILPFDSFADAVKSRLPMPQESTTTSNPQTGNQKNDFILNTLKIKM